VGAPRILVVEAKRPVLVEGDASAIRQVVANLIQNALAHTPPDTSVTVRAAEGRGLAVLEVADTGPGMEPRDAARAFDRFWQAGTGRVKAGAGLGLPIVAAVVHAHGGEVVMDTAPARGTVVRVALPVDDLPRKPAGALQVPLRSGAEDGTRGEHCAQGRGGSDVPTAGGAADP
jgi:two-component system OmpR family sensor kinase